VHDIVSPALEGNLQGNPPTQPVKVYLPPGYENFPDNSYPVVYLLHPYTGDYNIFYENFNLLSRLNKLIAEKSISPMIVVTPNAKTAYDGSFYVNSYVTGNWEDFIMEDVKNYIEDEYHILERQKSRGLAGFSMGGHGTAILGLKHYSIFSALGIIGGPNLDMEEMYFNPPWKDHLIDAATINKYRPGDPWYIHACYALAAALTPDSTFAPILGRLPFTAEGVLIDSIWQKWLQYDPTAMIQANRDSILKYSTFQIYIGDSDDLLPNNETFHQTLLDNGIDHGYHIYSGGHTPAPVLSDLLLFFSESLEGAVPTVRSLEEYGFKDGEDTVVFYSDMDGTLYFVPDTVPPDFNSITQYTSGTTDIVAGEEKAVSLSEFVSGSFLVYAITGEDMVSNIPERLWVVDRVPEVMIQVRDNHTNQNVSKCNVYLNGKSFWKETEEELQVTGWVYDTCSIQIASNFYNEFDTTVVVRSDTILVFDIQYSLPEPVLELQTGPILEKTDYLRVMMSQSGMAYITPEDTPGIADSITKYAIKSNSVSADRPAVFSLLDIPEGTYMLFGLTSSNRMATETFIIQIIDHFPACSVDVKDASSKELLESVLLVVNGQDTIQGLKGNFDLTGYYDTCSITISREGYIDFDTTLVLLSDLTYTIFLSSSTSLFEESVPQIEIFPNPTSGFLSIELNTSGQSLIKITDINGKLIRSESIERTRAQLDLSSFQKGVYFITIRSKDFLTTRKIVKL
jgi:S-formylglutathione hydrolase FrmB